MNIENPFIKDLSKLPGRQVRIQARLSEVYPVVHGEDIALRLMLDDASGRIFGLVRPNEICQLNTFHTPCHVEIVGSVRREGDFNLIDINRIWELKPEKIESAAKLLPRRLCPEQAQDALMRLIALERQLPPSLRAFLQGVLLDPGIGMPFLTCRASVQHHHNFQGGLLVHSTHMLDSIAMLLAPLPNLHPMDVPITQLAYLLHDLGKIETVGRENRPAKGRWLQHEQVTLILLGPHLDALFKRDPFCANGLTYILSYLAMPTDKSKWPQYIGADAVILADRFSTATTRNRTLNAISSHLVVPQAARQAANDREYQKSITQALPADSNMKKEAL